ncbi:MAG: hypothetical protein U9O94_00765 [Nanoarchaeota archaeon]|nr:hypothetical protein [Nanoarchaeota archaeon]
MSKNNKIFYSEGYEKSDKSIKAIAEYIAGEKFAPFAENESTGDSIIIFPDTYTLDDYYEDKIPSKLVTKEDISDEINTELHIMQVEYEEWKAEEASYWGDRL